jgi:predicted nucleic acid-binding protein
MDLAEQHGLWGYDAVQLASAAVVHDLREANDLPPLTFVSADNALNETAQRVGLSVENPNSYP